MDSADYKHKIKENEKRNKYLDLAKELKKVMDHQSDDDTNYNCCTWNSSQCIKVTGRVENWRTSREHPNYSITNIGKNTEMGSGDMLSLGLQWKTIGSRWCE